jgi:hypothetical protein
MIHPIRTSFSIHSTGRNQEQRTPMAYFQYRNGIWTVSYGERFDSPVDRIQMKEFNEEMEKLRREFIQKDTRSEQSAKNGPSLGCSCLWRNLV